MINRLIHITRNSREIKFLIVGAYNTIFSFALGNIFFYFLKLPYFIILAAVHVISIMNSYSSYKIFVFRTKGHVIKELLKANATYAAAFVINLLLMFIFINLLGMGRVLAFNISTIIVVATTYFLHKNFTFKNQS